jgi:hypothetical protein
MIWRKSVGFRNSITTGFSRETAFVPEIGRVVTITGGWQHQFTTEPRDELFRRGGVTVSRYVARQGASRHVGVSIATKTT